MPSFTCAFDTTKVDSSLHIRVTLYDGRDKLGSATLIQIDRKDKLWRLESYSVVEKHQGKGLTYALTWVMLREVGKRDGTKVDTPAAHGGIIKMLKRLEINRTAKAFDPTTESKVASFETTDITGACQRAEVEMRKHGWEEQVEEREKCIMM